MGRPVCIGLCTYEFIPSTATCKVTCSTEFGVCIRRGQSYWTVLDLIRLCGFSLPNEGYKRPTKTTQHAGRAKTPPTLKDPDREPATISPQNFR